MKDLIIFGASGFGREVAWAVERINKISPTWNLIGFMDDAEDIQGNKINGYPVLGKTGDIGEYCAQQHQQRAQLFALRAEVPLHDGVHQLCVATQGV